MDDDWGYPSFRKPSHGFPMQFCRFRTFHVDVWVVKDRDGHVPVGDLSLSLLVDTHHLQTSSFLMLPAISWICCSREIWTQSHPM